MSLLLPEGWRAWAQVLDAARVVRGLPGAVVALAVAVALLLIASRLTPLGAGLRPTGALPAAVRVGATALRLGASVCGFVALLALLPSAALPVLWILLLALTVASGLSAQSWLPDVLGGVTLLVGDGVRAGEQVWWSGGVGVVRRVGLRAVVVVRADGTEQTVPTRALLEQGFTRDRSPWPSVEVTLWVDDVERGTLDRAREAALLSPWRASAAPVHVHPPTAVPGACVVRTRVVAWEHAEDHARSVRRVFQSLRGNDDEPSRVGTRA